MTVISVTERETVISPTENVIRVVTAERRIVPVSSGVAAGVLENVGGGAEVFRDRVGTVSNLRTLAGADGVTVNQLADTLEIGSAKLGGLTHRTFEIEAPAVNDKLTLFLPAARTLTEINVVLRGSLSPSITWELRQGADPSAAGTLIHTKTTTATTAVDAVTSITAPAIPADVFVWLNVTAVSGTVDHLILTAGPL